MGDPFMRPRSWLVTAERDGYFAIRRFRMKFRFIGSIMRQLPRQATAIHMEAAT